MLYRTGRLAEAITVLRSALAADPGNADAHAKLGQSLLRLNRTDEAREAFEEAYRLDPNAASPLNNLGLVYVMLGRPSDGEAMLRRVLVLQPNLTASSISLAKLLNTAGRNREAIEIAEAGLEFAPSDLDLHWVLGQSYLAESALTDSAGNSRAAERHFWKCVEQDPNNSAAYAGLGILHQSRGDFEQAERLFERSIALNPNQGLSYLGLTRAGKLGEAEGALVTRMEELADSGTIAANDLASLQYALGKGHDDLGETEEAMRSYDEANRLSLELRRGRPFDRDAYAQSIDRTIRVFDKRALEGVASGPLPAPTPILIVGVIRSGTTLLEQIIASHPDVCPCGELQFWNRRGQELPAGKVPSPDHARDLAAAYRAALIEAGADERPFATDKQPHNYEHLGLFHLAFPHAPIVYVERDPIDTCISIWTTPYTGAPDFVYDKANIAFVYAQHRRLMEHWRRALPPSRVFELSYARLVSDPEAVLRALLDYCGLPWSDAVLHHEANERVVRTPSYWQVRQPFYGGSIGRGSRYPRWAEEFGAAVRQEGL